MIRVSIPRRCGTLIVMMVWELVIPNAPDLFGAEFVSIPVGQDSLRSSALAVSASGQFVTGIWTPAERPICNEFFTCVEAFVWDTHTGDFQSLGPETSEGRDISDDGSVVVGAPAFRWTEEDGVQNLNDLVVDFEISLPKAVSADGNVVVGSSKTGTGEDLVRQAFVWTARGDAFQLGDLPGGIEWSTAVDVSADGRTVAGNTSVDGNGGEPRSQAFRWTAEKGIMGLGWIPGFEDSNTALAISPDGGTIVGRSYAELLASTQAFRWTEADGIVGLGFLEVGDVSIARDVSQDGKIIVGTTLLSEVTGAAFVWDRIHGMRNLQDLLVDEQGLETELSGWRLNFARAISADGQTIVGSGTTPSGESQAWLVRIPELLPVKAGDANLDERFDQLDIVQVLQSAKYLTDQPATWGDGDWDGAPGLTLDDPPEGDGLFNQFDIVAALTADNYTPTALAATTPGNQTDVTQLVYNADTGAMSLDVPEGQALTSVLVTSRAEVFLPAAAINLNGAFDTVDRSTLFKATLGGSFGSINFGPVAPTGLDESFLLEGLSISGSWATATPLERIQIVSIPEPSSLVLLFPATCLLVPSFPSTRLWFD